MGHPNDVEIVGERDLNWNLGQATWARNASSVITASGGRDGRGSVSVGISRGGGYAV